MGPMKTRACLALCLLLAGPLRAGLFPPFMPFTEEEASAFWDDYKTTKRALTGNRPSFFGYASDGSESRIAFEVSVKYPLIRVNAYNNFFFVYNGAYDFFLGSRDSSPVVS